MENKYPSKATTKSHANMTINQRLQKARKIEMILKNHTSLEEKSILEIGTGSGIISNYFSTLTGEKGTVTSVDIIDERLITKGFHFELVKNEHLPFDDDSFDIIISNHVLEHVGNYKTQKTHLFEMKRTLRDHGYIYLAFPNRYSIIEPHYRLPFLSWLPNKMASLYLRIVNKADKYDC